MAGVGAFEDAKYVRNLLKEPRGAKIPIALIVDSRSLPDLLSAARRVAENPLNINVTPPSARRTKTVL